MRVLLWLILGIFYISISSVYSYGYHRHLKRPYPIKHPPKPRVIGEHPPRPGPNYIWVEGHYDDGEWIPGHWKKLG